MGPPYGLHDSERAPAESKCEYEERVTKNLDSRNELGYRAYRSKQQEIRGSRKITHEQSTHMREQHTIKFIEHTHTHTQHMRVI